VLAENTRAVALYESLGFAREGVRARFVRHPDGRYEDDLIMTLALPG
jgi:putative acetyltransferase